MGNIEIEAKFRLDDPAAMAERLSSLGAEGGRCVTEQNTFFDTPEGLLRRSDRGLRIRVETDADGRRRAVLTYKGPRKPGELKVRPEEETVVDDPETTRGILTGLGYRVAVEFQKRRTTWRLGEATVCLDELPELGRFIEIEGPSEEAVQRVRAQLGLESSESLTAGYASIVAAHLAGRGDRGRSLTFS